MKRKDHLVAADMYAIYLAKAESINYQKKYTYSEVLTYINRAFKAGVRWQNDRLKIVQKNESI